jgi:hypothetical protein
MVPDCLDFVLFGVIVDDGWSRTIGERRKMRVEAYAGAMEAEFVDVEDGVDAKRRRKVEFIVEW